MLAEVTTPEGKTVRFEYDALGRRTAKLAHDKIIRYFWDGNVILHEWQDTAEVTTWVYDGSGFNPAAKLQGGNSYTIINDYMGTPIQAYDQQGALVWDCQLDIYGGIEYLKGERGFIPFRYQGQYEDEETGLYYNRFRFYDPNTGSYLSQDPIGLEGYNPTFYGYVKDVNSWVDVFGLHCSKKLSDNLEANGTKRPPNTIAHHIVGSGKRAKPAKDILLKHGIDIDSYKNGVFLPNGPKSKAPGHMHTGRHVNDYIDKVNQDIINADNIGGKPAVEKQLEIIREQLLNEKYTPLQK